MACTYKLLTALKKSVIPPPPVSGTLQLPDSYFSLFYKLAKDGHAARHINFANAAPDELEQLAQACEPASSSCGENEDCRRAGTMGWESFRPMLNLLHTDMMKIIRECLLEGTESTKTIKIELYELNVCSEGSFVGKPQVDTPRSEKMFGSLVIVFPTAHEGGALLLREQLWKGTREWTFDSSQALAAAGQPSIGYAAFLSTTEHEVAPVTSGHRVTLTYNLYFDDAGGPLFANDAVSENPILPQPANEGAFREAFAALLEDPEFLADGGALAFGLRHVYPIKNNLERVHGILQGSDAVVYQSVRMLGYEPVLYVHYDVDPPRGVIIDGLLDFEELNGHDRILDIACMEGGIYVAPESWAVEDSDSRTPQPMEWVTPATEFNAQKGAIQSSSEEDWQTVTWVCGNVCLVVRIGRAGDRLAYPTVAELDKAFMRWASGGLDIEA